MLGGARALENAGYSADQGMGIGIDGSRACDAFGSGKPSAFRGTMWLNSANHGALAIEDPARIDQGRDGAAGPVLHRPGIHHRRQLRLRLQGEALPLTNLAVRLHGRTASTGRADPLTPGSIIGSMP